MTILFCDFVDFDKIINVEKHNIVRILDFIFREFDNICMSHGIQKIEVSMILFLHFLIAFLRLWEKRIWRAVG